VFPDAQFKLYITASAEERANRRFLELKRTDDSVKIDVILADIKARDERDKNRSIAPLVPSEDAIVVDTTKMNAKQVFEHVYDLYTQALIAR
jgi:cytidylate kinase